MAIDREDFIPDDAIKAPLEMAANMEVAAKSYDDVIQKTKALATESDKTSESITDLNSVLVKLSQQEQQLVTLQNKHAVEVKKLTDTQVKQRKEIEALNAKLKEKKKLEEDNAKAVEALDNQTGGLISKYKTLGKEMLALATSPWIAVVGGLIGTFFALKNAAEVYYKTSGEGEDALAEKINASDAALNVVKNRWAQVGKAASDATGKMGFWASFVTEFAIRTGQTKLANEMLEAAKKAVEVTREDDQLSEEIADHAIKRARDEREMAELIYKSKQKNLYTDKQRLDFLTEAQAINKALLNDEKVFADRRVEVVEDEIANRLQIEASTLRAFTEEERHNRLTEAEYKKLADAKVAVINADARFYEEERKNAAAIAGLEKEIADERKRGREEAEKTKAAEFDLYQKKLNRNQQIAQAEINFQNEVFQNFKTGFKTEEELRQEALMGELEMLDLIEAQKEIDRQKDIDHWGNVLIAASAFGNAISGLFSSIFSRRLSQLDEEKEKLGENAEKNKKQIEAVEKERRKQIRETAIFEKLTAVAQGGIALSLAILKALGNPFQVAAAIALGTIQLASIAAKPIPALFKGVRGFKGGVATVGEMGQELVRVPGVGSFLTPNRTTVMNLPAGTDVIPHGETEAMLQRGEVQREDLLVGELRRLKHPDFIRMHDDVYEVRETKEGSKTYTRRRIHGS